ncbi:tyrosine-type recombinase/integrase [Sporolituus thermophilus]|uniref:Phage integrase, N-terminal SAM-like domain n=1 Tax=Sporolituus thermophilus DSM 23256 TaxID=1123285 RepID=A0A1G7MTC4_9FIRM|nr:site-specific integrase [Sporolituus thermophilus]SDF64947.1 Phage integrase, N-terminal SAM-like domain [Sporolituus thermophilus DSM 23256]
MARKRGHGEGTAYYNEKRQRWEAQFSYQCPETGETKRKKFTGKSQKEVMAKGRKWLQEIENGLMPDADKLTVGYWLDRWLEDYTKPAVKVRTYERYESIIKLYLKPRIGQVPLQKLQNPDVQRLFNQLAVNGKKDGSGLSSHSLNSVRICLHAALDKAVSLGYIARNPADDIRIAQKKKRDIKAMTEEQAKKLLDVARGYEQKHFMIILLALSTGMRRGEIFGLKWSDIDLDKGEIYVQRELTPISRRLTGREGSLVFQDLKTPYSYRRLPIPPEVVRELKRLKRLQAENRLKYGELYFDDDLVICSEIGQPYNPNTFDKVYKSMLDKAGMPKGKDGFCFHDMRHTHATLLLKKGVNVKVVSERLGHASVKVTLDTYSHVLPDMQEQVLEKLKGMFI